MDLAKVTISLLAASCFTALAEDQQLRMPLTEREVEHLVSNRVPSEHVVEIARQYRLAFQIEAQTEQRLIQAGATRDLVRKLSEFELHSGEATDLKTSKPTPPTLIVSSQTPSVEVYLGNVRIGQTSSEGMLKVPNVSPGAEAVRISREGYQDFEGVVELKDAETTTLVVPFLTPEMREPVAMARPDTKQPTGTNSANSVPKIPSAPYVVKDAFHVIGIPALKRNNKFDLQITATAMLFSKGGRRVYRIPFERLRRVQMNPTERQYAKATYGAVVALGAPGLLMLAVKNKVDALIIDYENERGGTMEMVVQVPRGVGALCLDRLAHGGISIGPA